MKLLLVSTGGTIAMAADTGASRFEHDAHAFLAELDGSGNFDGIEFDTLTFSQSPSAALNSQDAQALADTIEQHAASHDAFVVTHGTDTLEETAFYLELVRRTRKPIVFTGAMKTAGQPGYEGIANLRDAVRVAAAPASVGKGVLVVADKDILSALHCAKLESERYRAFGSLQTGKLGAVNGGRVFYYYETRETPRLENRTRGKVSLLKLHYDLNPDLAACAFEKSDIVVIEGLGSGRVQAGVAGLIGEWSARRLIVLTTRVPGGHLHDDYDYPGSYHHLKRERIVLSPLSALKSALLARLCLGNGLDFERTKRRIEDFWC